MSRRSEPPPGVLVASVIYRDEEAYRRLVPCLTVRFGPVSSVGGPFPFDRTDYYEREMGPDLVRRFVVFETPLARDGLVGAKLAAWELEKEFSADGRRAVNIDPGLLTDENFVLATGKNYSHRVYLGQGVFADLALVYRKGSYMPLPWTYPDYADEAIRSYLGSVRTMWRRARAGRGAA